MPAAKVTVETYGQLPDEFRFALTRDDVRNVLRPQHGLLLELWLKHEGRSAAEFEAEYSRWLALLPSETASSGKLHDHLLARAAQTLGYGVEALGGMLAALKLDRKASLEDLVGRGDDRSDDESASRARTLPSSGEQPAEQPDAPERQPAEAAAHAPGLPASGGLDAPFAFSEPSVPGGLRVASGLTPRASDPEAPEPGAEPENEPENEYAVGAHQDEQGALPGMAVEEMQRHRLDAALGRFADVVGIAAYVQPAPALDYGYFMEIAAPGVLGATPADLAVQGWWLLANLSGQFEDDIDALLERTDDAGHYVLPDTGDQGYRGVVADSERWPAVVAQCLGGETLIHAHCVLRVLCDPWHPLNEALIELLEAMRGFNAARYAGA